MAEYDTKIEYRKGKNNIHAEMLSRIKPRQENLSEGGIIDTEEWVDPDAFGGDEAHERLSLEAHGIDLAK